MRAFAVCVWHSLNRFVAWWSYEDDFLQHIWKSSTKNLEKFTSIHLDDADDDDDDDDDELPTNILKVVPGAKDVGFILPIAQK